MNVLVAVLNARLLVAGVAGSMPGAPSPVSVVVDAAVIDGDALAQRLVIGTEPLAVLRPGASWPAASILVTGELLDFRVQLTVADGAGSTSQCPCTHAELVAHVQRELALALSARPACPTLAPTLTPPAAPAPLPDARPPQGLRPSGRLGVALIGLGGLGLGAGAGVWVAVEVTRDEKFLPRTDLRPLGVAAVAAGASALASGALLLLLDRRARRSRSRSNR